MNAKVIFVACLVAAVAADRPEPSHSGYNYESPAPTYSAPAPAYGSHQKGMPFDFSYGVVDHYSGNDYAHSSNSDGNVVRGEYRVALPDGRTQIVSYTADHEHGYVAEVSYEGEAQYPAYSAPANAYEAPAQTYGTPAPTYGTPAPTYGTPAPTYGTPAPLYAAPH